MGRDRSTSFIYLFNVAFRFPSVGVVVGVCGSWCSSAYPSVQACVFEERRLLWARWRWAGWNAEVSYHFETCWSLSLSPGLIESWINIKPRSLLPPAPAVVLNFCFPASLSIFALRHCLYVVLRRAELWLLPEVCSHTSKQCCLIALHEITPGFYEAKAATASCFL